MGVCGEPEGGPGWASSGRGRPTVWVSLAAGGPLKTTGGGGAGSPEGAGQGSGRVFVGAKELEVGSLRVWDGAEEASLFLEYF